MQLQLYLHFPFCKQKCFYCDFCSFVTDESTVAAYCRALENEIKQAGRRFENARVSTVFLGGGTPTLVAPKLLEGVLKQLRNSFDFLPDVEFTSEGNPGTLAAEWLQTAQRYGLNRLSLGVQAAQDHLLRSIGRIHDFKQAQDAVALARSEGIRNINLDAMFGLPNQTEGDYLDTLAALRDLGAQHISAYSLILEEGTRLYERVETGKVSLPDEEEVAAMYERGIEWLKAAGYERYEVSNFARPGFACRHNIGYWQGEWYLGLGAAAHSMLPADRPGAAYIRRANGTDVKAYINGCCMAEEEPVSHGDAMFETMMLGLRTTKGVNANCFFEQFGTTLESRYGMEIEGLIRDGLGFWNETGGRSFVLSDRGIEVQNEVLMRLMKG